MAQCSLERHGRVFALKLLGNNEHWFTPSLLADILSALKTVQESNAGALVTTSEGKYFSNGLHLEWMKEDLRTRVPVLLRGLEQVVIALLRLNVPTIAAVCGHAAGGGLLFAMAHDHCCMRRDRGFLYSSAVDINFVIPPGSIALLKSKMTPKAFKDVVLHGVKFTAPMALDAGIIDSHHADANETFEAALKLGKGLADKGWERAAYQALRLTIYSDVIEKLESDSNSDCVGFVKSS